LNGWKETKIQLDEGTIPLKINLPGRKQYRNVKPYYSLIGSDAVHALKHYVDHIRQHTTYTFPEGHDRESETIIPIFVSRNELPLSESALNQYWAIHRRRLGLAPPPVSREKGGRRHRTGKNIHELRDSFRTIWTKTGRAPEVAEFIMGHVGDPLGYDKAYRDEKWVRGARAHSPNKHFSLNDEYNIYFI